MFFKNTELHGFPKLKNNTFKMGFTVLISKAAAK